MTETTRPKSIRVEVGMVVRYRDRRTRGAWLIADIQTSFIWVVSLRRPERAWKVASPAQLYLEEDMSTLDDHEITNLAAYRLST